MAAETPPPETVDFIFEQVLAYPDAQTADAKDLDSKAFQVIGLGTVVIGLANLVRSDVVIATGLLIASLLAYAALATLVLWTIWPREFYRPLNPTELWQRHWQDDPRDLKHAIIDSVAKITERHQVLLRSKGRALRWALYGLVVEASLIGVRLVAVSVS